MACLVSVFYRQGTDHHIWHIWCLKAAQKRQGGSATACHCNRRNTTVQNSFYFHRYSRQTCISTNNTQSEKQGYSVQSVVNMTYLGVSGTGLGVGVERLGLAISSPMRNISNTQLLLVPFVFEYIAITKS